MLQRKMLMSIASVLVLVALIAGATMAWFTDSETVAATFTAGTVNVGINDPTDIAIINPGDIIKFGELEDDGYYHVPKKDIKKIETIIFNKLNIIANRKIFVTNYLTSSSINNFVILYNYIFFIFYKCIDIL